MATVLTKLSAIIKLIRLPLGWIFPLMTKSRIRNSDQPDTQNSLAVSDIPEKKKTIDFWWTPVVARSIKTCCVRFYTVYFFSGKRPEQEYVVVL